MLLQDLNADIQRDQLRGNNDICAEEIESLNSVRKARLGTVCFDLGELLCETDGTLGAHEALGALIAIFRSEHDVGGNEDLAAANASDASRFKRIAGVDAVLQLCFDELSRDRGGNFNDDIVQIGDAAVLEINTGIQDQIDDLLWSGSSERKGLVSLLIETVDIFVRLTSQSRGSIRDRQIQKLGICLRTVNVIDHEIEVFCLLDHNVVMIVLQHLGGCDLGILFIVGDCYREKTADLNSAAFFTDLAFIGEIGVVNGNSFMGEVLNEVLTPDSGNKILNSPSN